MRLDLHRHLEGSHSAVALAAVAAEFDIRHAVFFDAQKNRHRTAAELAPSLTLPGPDDDSGGFVDCIARARHAYVSEAAIVALARRAFDEAADDTDGFEMRVSLFSMTRTLFEKQRGAWRDVVPVDFAEQARRILLGVLRARDESAAEKKKPMLLRVGFSRVFESPPHQRAMAEVLREHKAALSGLDVLGIVPDVDKEPLKPELRDLLLSLRKDLPDLTIHAGEFEGAASVDRTLDLDVNAIGHGIRSLERDETLRRLRDGGVTLEVCPNSNRLLLPSTLRALEQRHGGKTPLRALQEARVRCVLGSDDPTPMGTSHTAEHAYCVDHGVDVVALAADTARRWQQLPQPR